MWTTPEEPNTRGHQTEPRFRNSDSRWNHIPSQADLQSLGLGLQNNQGPTNGVLLEPPVFLDWSINPELESQLDEELKAKKLLDHEVAACLPFEGSA